MAATKKPVTKTAATVKAESVKETVEKVETVKEVVKEAVKGTAKKQEAVKKQETVKKATKRTTAKKAEVKSAMHIQFGGKSYAQEDLMKIAKDVWKYDLKQKVGELVSVELYVKPEESKVYYVMNDKTGSFDI